MTKRGTKLVRIGTMLFAYAGQARIGELLRYHLKVPDKASDQDAMAFMSCVVVPALRSVVVDQALVEKASDGADMMLLVAAFGRLFIVYSDFGIVEPTGEYLCGGSGGEYASGSLFSTAGIGLDPASRIRRALEAAAHHSASCAAPFVVMAA